MLPLPASQLTRVRMTTNIAQPRSALLQPQPSPTSAPAAPQPRPAPTPSTPPPQPQSHPHPHPTPFPAPPPKPPPPKPQPHPHPTPSHLAPLVGCSPQDGQKRQRGHVQPGGPSQSGCLPWAAGWSSQPHNHCASDCLEAGAWRRRGSRGEIACGLACGSACVTLLLYPPDSHHAPCHHIHTHRHRAVSRLHCTNMPQSVLAPA